MPSVLSRNPSDCSTVLTSTPESLLKYHSVPALSISPMPATIDAPPRMPIQDMSGEQGHISVLPSRYPQDLDEFEQSTAGAIIRHGRQLRTGKFREATELIQTTLEASYDLAEYGQGVGDIDFNLASVRGAFDDIQYGIHRGKPACYMRLVLTVTSHRDLRLQDVRLRSIFDNGQLLMCVNQPKLLDLRPGHILAERRPGINFKKFWRFGPKVAVNNISVEAGEVGGEREGEVVGGWEITGNITSAPCDGNKATWNAYARRNEEEGLQVNINLEAIVRYPSSTEEWPEPFFATFKITAKMNMFRRVRWIGRNRPVVRRCAFKPLPTKNQLSLPPRTPAGLGSTVDRGNESAATGIS